MSRQLFVTVVMVIALVAIMGLETQTVKAQSIRLVGNCNTAIASATLDATGTWYLKIYAAGQTQIGGAFIGPLPLVRGIEMSFNPPLKDGTTVFASILDGSQNPTGISASYNCSSTALLPCVNPDLLDGRLNAVCGDQAQSAALYCNPDYNSLHVVMLQNSMAGVAFDFSQHDLNKFSGMPKANTLIKQEMGIQLWRLTTGELQFNTPNHEVYIFGRPVSGPVTFNQICLGIVNWYRTS